MFFDDIITGPTKGAHLKNLSAVLERIQQAGLHLRKQKCVFFQDSVTYLGHIIDHRRVRASEEKTRAIQQVNAPQNQAELRSFLGMINYFNQFFPHMAEYTSQQAVRKGMTAPRGTLDEVVTDFLAVYRNTIHTICQQDWY